VHHATDGDTTDDTVDTASVMTGEDDIIRHQFQFSAFLDSSRFYSKRFLQQFVRTQHFDTLVQVRPLVPRGGGNSWAISLNCRWHATKSCSASPRRSWR
jgi:hypothetical protein